MRIADEILLYSHGSLASLMTRRARLGKTVSIEVY